MRTFFGNVVLGAVAAVLAMESPALAWGEDGHEYIATVARDRLRARNPLLEQRFQAILANDILLTRGKDKKGKALVCHGRTMREIAKWADCIRYMTSHSRTGDFHFDDIPLCTKLSNKPPPPPPPAKVTYCTDGNCGTGALPRFMAALKDKQTPARERAEALAWVIHIVGDLHQPLHTADNRDIGGNSVTIAMAEPVPGLKYQPEKLHSLWDTGLVLEALGQGKPAVAAVRALADANAAAWAEPNPQVWVNSAHEIARQAYDELEHEPACNAGAADAGTITAAYVGKFEQPVREQLARAAIQLTNILEDALE